MGGCYTATAEGHEAFLKNPAALAFADKAEFTLGGRVIALGSMTIGSYEEDTLLDYSIKYGINPKLWDLSFSSNLPIEGSVSVGAGLGWGSFYDAAVKYNMTEKPRGGKEEEMNADAFGGYNALSLAAGAGLDSRWAAGLSYGFGALSSYGYTWESPSGGYDSTKSASIEYSYPTVGGNVIQLGLLAKPTDALRVGLTYTGGLDLSVEDGEVTYRNVYTPGDTSMDLSDFDVEIPSQISLGLAYDVSPQFTFAAQYDNRPYHRVKVHDQRLSLDDGNAFRFGLEYRFGPAGSPALSRTGAFRAGVAFDNSAERARSDKEKPAPITIVTAGFGIPAGPVSLDLGAEFRMLTTEDRSSSKTYKNTDNNLRVAMNLTYATSLFGGK
jgi:long-subunit fatty acid transport protein